MDLSSCLLVNLTKLSKLFILKYINANIIVNNPFMMFKKVMVWPVSRNSAQ